MSTKDNIMVDLISTDIIKNIKELFNNKKTDDEFEVMLFNFNKIPLSMEKYIAVLKFINYRAKHHKLSIEESDTLDISYVDDKFTNYRITISGIDNINNNIEQLHKYKSHIIFSTLLTKMTSGDDSITAMKKIKDKENVVDASDINARFRLAHEVKLTKQELSDLKNLTHDMGSKILFRLKQRVSCIVWSDKDSGAFIRDDITSVRSNRIMNKINDSIANYELEVEYVTENDKSKKVDHINHIFGEVVILLKTIQQCNWIITNSVEDMVIREYARITGLNPDTIISLDARNPVSLEIQHVTEILPNRYAVTDKADGDRYFLIILDLHVYLISTNLNVKDTGISLHKNLSDYNDSILDGEYIFLASKNRHLYMSFECLFIGGKDIRKIPEFFERLKYADDIINKCFILPKQKGFVIENYTDTNADKDFNLDNIEKFHVKQLKQYTDSLNHDIEIDKKFPLIRRKYFIPVVGAKPWEIFKYSVLLWNKCTSDPNIKYPYLLDGLIYHPLVQEYITSVKDSKLFEYKWKPPTKNSIDFYIEFKKDRDGKTLSVYDNSVNNTIKNNPYKICYLYVGNRGKYEEEPVLFRENENGYICHIFMKGDNAVDIEGNLLSDNTVVEFYYNNNPEIDERFRWLPIRTRYDKTESVMRYRKKYGNYSGVAQRVWRSIINPVLISDFEDLARGNDSKDALFFYDKKINFLRTKISHELIISSVKENVYFQVTTNLAQPMKQFHNWIKSILIYTHCSHIYEYGKHLTVLDLACGRGSDIMRFYYTEVEYMVGLDIDYESLISGVDGALSRYNKFKKSKDRFPKMYFVHGDAGALLNYDDQFRAIRGMTNDNRILMEKFFNKDPSKKTQFDRLDIQFAIHYMLKNIDTWTNFKQNINDYLKPGGYFIATTYDALRIVELLKKSDVYTEYYTNNKGERKKLFEIVKKYPVLNAGDPIGLGNAIDFFAAWLFLEGVYHTEYLVDQKFLANELLNDCDLELVDTDTFDNVMEMHREFFANYAKYESVDKTRKFLTDAGKYYDTRDELNISCYNNTRLYRYYVFRKKDNAKPRDLIQKTQKGGSGDDTTYELDISDPAKFKIAEIKDTQTSCCSSIHNVLKTHKLIPGTLSSSQFFKDFNIELKNDDSIDHDYLKRINKQLSIYHEDNNGSKKKILDGLNIFIGEQDCNGHFEFEFATKSKNNDSNKAILLTRENSIYKPVYRLEDGKRRGIFNMSDPMIKHLTQISD
jgi:SAM-dependent methyltransferase